MQTKCKVRIFFLQKKHSSLKDLDMAQKNEIDRMNHYLSVAQEDEEDRINCELCLIWTSTRQNKREILQLEMQLRKMTTSISRLENEYAVPDIDPDPAKGSGTSHLRDPSPPTFAAPVASPVPAALAGPQSRPLPSPPMDFPVEFPVAPVRRRGRRYENSQTIDRFNAVKTTPNGHRSKIPVKSPAPTKRPVPNPRPIPHCGPETGAIRKLLKIKPLNQLTKISLIPKKVKSDIEKFNEKMGKN